MCVGRELPRLISFVGEKNPLGGPLCALSSLGGRWGVGIGVFEALASIHPLVMGSSHQ